MKKLLICLLLLPSLAWGSDLGQDYARLGMILGGGASAAASTFCSSATASQSVTGLLCEDFGGAVECTAGYSSNCRGAWTVTKGTPDYDNATAIEGTYSALLGGCATSEDVRINRTFTATASKPQELYFTFKLGTAGTSHGTLALVTFYRGAGVMCGVQILDTALRVSVGGGTPADTVTEIAEDTLYHVWVNYTHGSANDSTCTVAFSTDGVRPTSGDAYALSTGGTDETDATSVTFHGEYASGTDCNDIYIDKVIIDDATIGDNPT